MENKTQLTYTEEKLVGSLFYSDIYTYRDDMICMVEYR